MTIFTDRIDAIGQLRSVRLPMQGGAYFNHDSLSDDYLFTRLLVAEADTARRLRVFLRPTFVFAGEPSPAEIDAIGPMPWHEEPGYDYEPRLWTTEDWGYLALRQRYVVRIDSVEMVYPGAAAAVFRVPSQWLRLDKKAGHVRFVPTGGFLASVGMSAYMLSAVAGGSDIPQALRLRYVAGLTNALQDWPDLIDLIYKTAVVRMIQDTYAPDSSSISADGLSQSSSVDITNFTDDLNRQMDNIAQAIHGVRMMVL